MKTFPTSVAWCFGILFISVSLIKTGSSEVQVVGPADRVVALAGDDIILPCSLKPSVSAEDMIVEWTGLNPATTENVHLYRQGRVSNGDQHPPYRGRTSMFHEELKNGNVSLKLTRVTLSDAGRYRCFIPTLTSQVKETTVQLFVESSEVVGSADPVVALAGDDVILPCSLKPSVSAEDMTVEWTRLDLKATENVHLYRQGRVSNGDQSTSYKGRTSVFNEELKNGNVSLKLTRVTLSDAGRYRCFLPTLTSQVKETTVQLIVGAVSQPVISIDGTKGWGVVLKCESGGWYPKPEMEWLDSSGTILPADGPPERHRDSEGLYAVRQHVTVDQTDTNRFTCRVNQPEINHLKETKIHVPDLTFPKSLVGLIVGLLILAAVVVLAALAGVYMWRKHTEEKERRKRWQEHLQKFEQNVKDFKLARENKRDVHFVNKHKDHLIQNVTMVIPIAIYLIRSERYSEIHAARTRQDQMRLLYEALNHGGKKLKSDFYRIVLDLEPDVVIDLGVSFVDDHKDQLIQKVTKVMPIMYELFYEELYCNTRIHQMTRQEQMELLYQTLEEAEDTRRVKSDFYRILLDLRRDVVKVLEEARRRWEKFRRHWGDHDDDDDLTGRLDKVTREKDGLQGDLNELIKNLTGQLEELRIENDGLKEELNGLKEELKKAKETVQSLSTSPGGQQETQTPSQKSERIEGMEMKPLPGGKSAPEMKSLPGSGRKSAPEEESLLSAGPQKDDLDELERGGRVATEFNSML